MIYSEPIITGFVTNIESSVYVPSRIIMVSRVHANSNAAATVDSASDLTVPEFVLLPVVLT